MATIYHQVGIRGSLDQVYKKLASTDGLAQWWTSDTRGRCVPDGTIGSYFGGFKMSMIIVGRLRIGKILPPYHES